MKYKLAPDEIHEDYDGEYHDPLSSCKLVWEKIDGQGTLKYKKGFPDDDFLDNDGVELEQKELVHLPVFYLGKYKEVAIYNIEDLDELFPFILSKNYGNNSVHAINCIKDVYEFYGAKFGHFEKLLFDHTVYHGELLAPPDIILEEVLHYSTKIKEFNMAQTGTIISLYEYMQSLHKEPIESAKEISNHLPVLISKFPQEYFERRHYSYSIRPLILKSVCGDEKKFLTALNNLEDYYKSDIDLMGFDENSMKLSIHVWEHLISNFSLKANYRMFGGNRSLLGHFWSGNARVNNFYMEHSENSFFERFSNKIKEKIFQENTLSEILYSMGEARAITRLINNETQLAELFKQYPNSSNEIKKHYSFNSDHDGINSCSYKTIKKCLDHLIEQDLHSYALIITEIFLTGLKTNKNKNLWSQETALEKEKKLKELEGYVLKGEFAQTKKFIKNKL